MTPFDRHALLAVLLAFYPIVSSASLARAREERPEYFAGGTLIGSKADKLKLPDGRIFDLIGNAGGPPELRHWQVHFPQPGEAEGLFPLEPGPLTYLEGETIPAPALGHVFEGLAAEALEQLGGSDGVLRDAGERVGVAGSKALLFDGGGTELADAQDAYGELGVGPTASDFADVVGQVDGVERELVSVDGDFDNAPEEIRLPDEPGIPSWPTDGGVEKPPPSAGDYTQDPPQS